MLRKVKSGTTRQVTVPGIVAATTTDVELEAGVGAGTLSTGGEASPPGQALSSAVPAAGSPDLL
jgi:hypothetical protein